MKRFRWQIILVLWLIAVSSVIYCIQLLIFHNPHETFSLLFQDLAFVPIHVLVVTLIIDQLLNVREKRAMLNKLNMVIGAFFSEVGTSLLKSFAGFDRHIDRVRSELLVTYEWTDQRFSSVMERLQRHDYQIGCSKDDLEALKAFLAGKRAFLLRLLENPNLLEHETFTELLWAIFHLTEELMMRDDLAQLTTIDESHIAGDVKRAYVILIAEWLAYMGHLKSAYPYLFSLALRTNPFDPNASIILK
jgi:hypothetical protein